MSDHQKIHELFNTGVKDIFKLFKELPSQKFKSKLHIQEMQTKMVRGMQTEDLYAINVIGPVIWSARNEIVSKDALFFLNRRYDMDVQIMCKEHKFNYDDAINTVGFMKDAYMSASKETQEQIFRLLIDLLKYYSQYAKVCQGEANALA